MTEYLIQARVPPEEIYKDWIKLKKKKICLKKKLDNNKGNQDVRVKDSEKKESTLICLISSTIFPF